MTETLKTVPTTTRTTVIDLRDMLPASAFQNDENSRYTTTTILKPNQPLIRTLKPQQVTAAVRQTGKALTELYYQINPQLQNQS